MGTTVYECGCMMSNSMFGRHNIIYVCMCRKHIKMMMNTRNKSPEDFAKKLAEILNKAPKKRYKKKNDKINMIK